MEPRRDPERGCVTSKQTWQPLATGPRKTDAIAAPASPGIRLHALVVTVGLIIVTLGIGWLVWSLIEWGRSSTPSYRLTDLRLVRRIDGAPAGLARVFVREASCLVLIVPTVVICCLLGIVFVMGASAPDGLLRTPRRAPWDVLSGTEVVRDTPQQPRYAELQVARYEAAQHN
jgi:hypothetical protein